MASDFDITNTKDLEKFARDLKAAGRDVQRDLYKGLNSVTKELRGKLKESALATLPATGGLAARVAGSLMSGRIRRGSTFGVKIQVKERKGQPFAAGLLDQGTNKHKVYGHGPLVEQSVTPGWFSTPWGQYGEDVLKAMLQVVDDIRARISMG